MRIRPEAELKLRIGFQRHVDRQANRYAAELAHAAQLSAIPVLIIGAAARVPGVLPLLGLFPFAFAAWFGGCLWRGRDPERRVWFCAFADGCMLLGTDTVPLLWSDVTGIEQV